MPIMHSQYREASQVRIDYSLCTRCGDCTRICPANVLSMDRQQVQVQDNSPFGCIGCGHCMMVCPADCIAVTGRGISRADLRELPPANSRATASQLEALLRSRRSVRRFTEQEIERQQLEHIAALAATAPMGIPPWDLGVVTLNSRLRVQQVAGSVIEGYRGFLKIFRPWLLTLLRPFLGQAKYEMFRHFLLPLAGSYITARDSGRDTLFWDAPAVLIFHASPYADAVDAAIAGTYAMLAAESLGLGSCIIGGAPPILQRNRELCAELGIPKGNRPVLALIVGHPAVRFRRTVQRHFTSTTLLDGPA